MKLLCMGEGLRSGVSDFILENARKLGNVEIVTGMWDGHIGAAESLTVAIRTLEKEGPESQPIPPAFAQNQDAGIVVGGFCPFSRAGMALLTDCKIVGVIRAGLENIDVQAATDQGKLVVNATGRNAHAVSDFTVGMLLAEVRNIARAHRAMMEGNWSARFSNQGSIFDMNGKTLGLFGYGYIGRLVAKKMGGFDMRIIVHDPYLKPEDVAGDGVELVDKETLFAESDFVSLHARWTEESHHTVGKKEIDAMKKTAYLVNTARSGLMDYDALYDALANRRIAGAALDVFDDEPLPMDNPFYKLDNVTLTPHRAGGTIDAQLNSPRLIFERIGNVIRGESLVGVVNPEVLDSPGFAEWLARAKKELEG